MTLAFRRYRHRAGVTLVEVLISIFITGVGMLALLTLFPLGALDLARAVKDDRTAALARDAQAFSKQGKELLARTRQFVITSLTLVRADPKTAAALREGYEDLAIAAASLEARLRELRPLLEDDRVQQKADQLLAQIGALKQLADSLANLLASLEGGVQVDEEVGSCPHPSTAAQSFGLSQ